jgi:hypothetical protein
MPIKLTHLEQDRTMKIKIKDLNTESMIITKEGIELEFRETDGKHTGDLVITPTEIIWNKGRTSKYGKTVNWPEFFKLMKMIS